MQGPSVATIITAITGKTERHGGELARRSYSFSPRTFGSVTCSHACSHAREFRHDSGVKKLKELKSINPPPPDACRKESITRGKRTFQNESAVDEGGGRGRGGGETNLMSTQSTDDVIDDVSDKFTTEDSSR